MAYVTHYLTEEPSSDAHVSEVDLRSRTVSRVLAVLPDVGTCETQNSGQGVLNFVSAIAILSVSQRLRMPQQPPCARA